MVIRQRSVKLNCQNFKKARFPRQFAISFRKQNENNCQERAGGLESSQMAPNEDFFQVILAQSGQGWRGSCVHSALTGIGSRAVALSLGSAGKLTSCRRRRVNLKRLFSTVIDHSLASPAVSVAVSSPLASSGLGPLENTSTSRGMVAWVRGVLLRCRIFFGDGKGMTTAYISPPS